MYIVHPISATATYYIPFKDKDNMQLVQIGGGGGME